MKLLHYIWRNITRNKLRSSLTIISVGFSLALMTVLYGYLAMQDAWGKAAATHNRIVVMNKQGFSGKVPIAYVIVSAARRGLLRRFLIVGLVETIRKNKCRSRSLRRIPNMCSM